MSDPRELQARYDALKHAYDEQWAGFRALFEMQQKHHARAITNIEQRLHHLWLVIDLKLSPKEAPQCEPTSSQPSPYSSR